MTAWRGGPCLNHRTMHERTVCCTVDFASAGPINELQDNIQSVVCFSSLRQPLCVSIYGPNLWRTQPVLAPFPILPIHKIHESHSVRGMLLIRLIVNICIQEVAGKWHQRG